MKKTVLLFILLSQFLFCATAEQVEQYLSISNAEEELILLESQFSRMQNSFSEDTNGSTSTYDMQLLSLRFKEYLQTHLSESEMDEILKNYKNMILLQFVSANADSADKNEIEAYINTLKDDPEYQARMDILEDISKALNNKESMIVMFDDLMKPLIQNAVGGKEISDEMMKEQREAYMKAMVENAKRETIYNTKDFSIEELKTLRSIVKTTAMGHEVKALYGATAYALKEFFLSIASRYDIKKHQR